MKSHKIEFFHVEIEEFPHESTDEFYYTNDIPAKDGVSYFVVVHT